MSAPAGSALGSLSLDLDNLWSYMKTHGSAGWEARPSYLEQFVPLALDALDSLGVRITFFIVGRDADHPAHRDVLAEIARRGHEVGNHSYEHEPWLHRYGRAELVTEIARTEDAIERSTGHRPTGFRGPGYSWSPALLDVLAARGYRYDASTLPTYLGPLARWWYFRTAQLDESGRAERAELFGTWADGRRPVKPYRWALAGGRTLLEIPVTTTPVVKTPFHFSYLLFLGQRSEALMRAYLGSALALCRLTSTAPSFLLHPLDLLGAEDAPAVRFFPGMGVSGARKRELFDVAVRALGRQYALGPIAEHARALEQDATLPLRAAAEA